MCWAGAGSQLSLAELTTLEPIFLFQKCKSLAFEKILKEVIGGTSNGGHFSLSQICKTVAFEKISKEVRHRLTEQVKEDKTQCEIL